MVKTSKKVRKAVGLALSALLVVGMVGCGNSANSANGGSKNGDTAISVVSREDGSGTRSAFVELTGVEEKDKDGNKIDNTTDEAIISNSTEIVMTTVAGNKNAVGYISLGSLNDTVKGVNIDGVEPTADNIVNGKYSLSRPFNIVTKDGLSEVAADFVKYIMSEDGQKVVEDNGYISQGNEGAYEASGLSGKVTVAGSSSVTPVMEKLAESYKKLNADVEIEVQQNDSTTGVTSAIDGICDIGMASRELKDTETSQGVTATPIALDGIAVIVNKQNPVDELTSDQVMSIFTGETQDWADVQ